MQSGPVSRLLYCQYFSRFRNLTYSYQFLSSEVCELLILSIFNLMIMSILWNYFLVPEKIFTILTCINIIHSPYSFHFTIILRTLFQAYAVGRALTQKLKELIPRQMFKVPIQVSFTIFNFQFSLYHFFSCCSINYKP